MRRRRVEETTGEVGIVTVFGRGLNSKPPYILRAHYNATYSQGGYRRSRYLFPPEPHGVGRGV